MFNLDAGSTGISLTSALPSITVDLTIEGTNAAGAVTISGGNIAPGFVITNGTVAISDLTIESCKSQGGKGGNGERGAGGGGMGAGGGIFVNENATVTLTNLDFISCSAVGGNGGNGGIFSPDNGGGGGGLGGNGADGALNKGGGGGGLYSDASGITPGTGGGKGADGATAPDSGNAFGGGGGGNFFNNGTIGGFAGGGSAPGGGGGFGGGGGGANAITAPGTGGFEGGNGGGGIVADGGGGGGGAGFGGAIFLRTSGNITLESSIESNQTTSGGQGGSGGVSPPAKDGGREGNGIYLMSGSTLTLNSDVANERTIADEISGPGSIIKTGNGIFNLTTTNRYSGTTTINNGIIIVNGSAIGSSFTVNAGGTLKGTGRVGPLTVNANGIVKPGNSIGTLTVFGNYIQNAGSTYQTEITAIGNASKLAITGTALINNPSTIEVTALTGEYDIDNQYTVLNADGGRTNEYSTFTITNPNELDNGTLNISYTPNAVELTFFTHPSNIIVFAKSLGFIGHGLLNQVNHFQSDLGFEQSILRYYQSLCKCLTKNIRPYFSANYLQGNFKNSTYTVAGPFSLAGPLLGFDYYFQNDIIIGGFFNYFRGWINTSNNKSRSSSNNYTASVYVQKIWEKFFFESAISGTFSDIRKARLSNNIKINEAKPNGYALSFQTRAAKILEYKKFIFLPNLALRYFYNYIDSYTEKFDRASRFQISSSNNNILEALVSTNCSYRYLVNSAEFIPQFEITYIRDLLKEKIFFTSTRTLLSEKRDHTIQTNPKNCVKLKGALDYRFKNCSLLNLSYIASFSTHQRITNEVHLGYRIDF